MFFLLFLARKPYHIPKEEMARKDVKEKPDYHGIGEMSITDYSIIWQFQWYYMDRLKTPRFPCEKRIHSKGHLNLTTEVLKDFSPGVFNRLCVTHYKNLEQRKFRTKQQANNISLFKSNSKSYGCQLIELTGSIPFSTFLDTSWTYGCQLRQITRSVGSSIFK